MSTTPVTISINVVDNNSAATLQKTETSVERIGMAGTAAAAQLSGLKVGLEQVGMAGTAAAAGLDSVGVGARNATRDVQMLGGAAAETGIGLSRFFRRELLERFPELVTAIRSVGTAFFALGAIEIGARMAEGLGHAYEKWLDLGKAERDYYDNITKNAGKDFLNFDSLNTAVVRMLLLSAEIDRLKEKQKEAGPQTDEFAGAFVTGFDVPGMKKATDELYEAKAKQDQGTIAALQAQHKWNLTLIEDNEKVGMVGAKGFHAIALEHENAIKRANEDHDSLVRILAVQNQLIDAQNKANPEKPQIPLTPLVGYDQGRDQKIKTADQLAAEKRIELVRNVSDATITAQHKADEDGLEGNAKWLASKKYAAEDAARELKRSLQETGDAEGLIAARVAAIRRGYDNEHLLAIKKQLEQSQLLLAESQAGTLTGIARTQAESAVAMQRIGMAEKAQSGGAGLSPDEQQKFDNERLAEKIKSDDAILEDQRGFYQSMNEIADQAGHRGLTGYAAINSEVQDAAIKAYEKWVAVYGEMDVADQRRIDAEQRFQDTVVAIAEDGGRRKRELTAQYAAQTQEIVLQANSTIQRSHSNTVWGILADEQSSTQRYIAEYQRRYTEAEQWLNKQLQQENLSVDERQSLLQQAAQREAAYYQQMNAQILNDTNQTRERLASVLEGFFKDPMGTIKKQAEHMMFEAMAGMLMQATGAKGSFTSEFAGLFGFGGTKHPSGGDAGTLAKLMGAAGGSQTLSVPATQLSYAGNVLIAAASDLSAAASTMGRGGFGGGGWNGGSTSPGGGGWGAPSSGAPGAGDIGVPGVYSLGGSLGPGAGSPFSAASRAASLFSGGAGTLSQALKLGSLIPGLGNAGTNSNIGPVASGDDYAKMLGGGGAAGMKMFSGAVSGGMGMFGALEGAYQKGSEFSGMLGGATSGAAIGSALMPGIGTAVGAAAGAIAGFVAGMFGNEARKKAAQEYLANTVTPKIESAMQKYYDGQESYDQAQRELASLQVQEAGNFKKWGSAGNSVYNSDGMPAFMMSAQLMLNAEKAGRGDVPRGTSEFHSGGFVAGFGPGDLGNGEGLAKLKRGEYIVDADTTARFRPALESLSSSRTMPMRPASSGGGMHLHVHAFDLPNFERFLSGGGDQKIVAAMNRYQGIYAGIADG